MRVTSLRSTLLLSCLLAVAGCVTQGNSSGPVTGAAAGGTSVGADANLERCDETLGTLAVDDGRDEVWWGAFVQNTQITTIEPMVRLIVQQSNCFVITSIGNTRLDDRMSRITDKQRNSGEFRAGSRQQKGQRVAADYYMEPAILFANSNTGGIGGALGGALGGSVGAALGGMMNQSSTSVTLSLFDIRGGVQIAASEGSSTSTDFGAALGALGGSAGGVLGGYSRTPAGKATVAAFVDAYNKMVVAVRNYTAQDVKGGLGTGGRLRIN